MKDLVRFTTVIVFLIVSIFLIERDHPIIGGITLAFTAIIALIVVGASITNKDGEE